MCWSRDRNDRRGNFRRRNFTRGPNNQTKKNIYNGFEFTNLYTCLQRNLFAEDKYKENSVQFFSLLSSISNSS